jgi:hypothetical protein
VASDWRRRSFPSFTNVPLFTLFALTPTGKYVIPPSLQSSTRRWTVPGERVSVTVSGAADSCFSAGGSSQWIDWRGKESDGPLRFC